MSSLKARAYSPVPAPTPSVWRSWPWLLLFVCFSRNCEPHTTPIGGCEHLHLSLSLALNVQDAFLAHTPVWGRMMCTLLTAMLSAGCRVQTDTFH